MNKHIIFLVMALPMIHEANAQFSEAPKAPVLKKENPASRGTPGMRPYSVGRPVVGPPGNLLTLGMGYNALTGEYIPNVCVSGGSVEYGRGEAAGSIQRKHIATVKNMAENSEASGSKVGFDFSYELVTVGAGIGSSSSNRFNSVDQFARIYVREATDGKGIVDPTWTQRGKTYSQGDIADFTDKCGTHYIRAIYRGHVLDQTYRFTMNSTTVTSQEQKDVSFGVGKIFGLDFSDTASQGKISSSSSMISDQDNRGIAQSMQKPSDVAALIVMVKYADEQFTKDARSAPNESATQVMLEYAPYRTVPQSSKIPAWPNEVMGYLTARATLYQLMASSITDLQYAMDLGDRAPTLYNVADKEEVSTKLKKALELSNAVRAAAQTCRTLINGWRRDDEAQKRCENGLDNALDVQKLNVVRLTLK